MRNKPDPYIVLTRNLNARLIRATRKSIAIRVKDGAVEIRAPYGVSIHVIERFVSSKADWIERALAKSLEGSARRERFAPSYGDAVLFRGRDHEIVASREGPYGFRGGFASVPPDLPPDALKQALVRLYRIEALAHFRERVEAYAPIVGARPASVKVSGAKRRWGSCSGRGNVNFAWRLIMAEDRNIDAVVAHELAHLIEPNHGAGFYRIAEAAHPGIRDSRKRLAALSKRLAAEDWEG